MYVNDMGYIHLLWGKYLLFRHFATVWIIPSASALKAGVWKM